MNKLKLQLRQELVANENSYQDFCDSNIVNNFDQYMRTGHYNSSICV